MTISEYCSYNGIPKVEQFLVGGNFRLPEGEHRLDFTIVTFTTTGESEFKVDGKPYKMGRRCIGVFRPGQFVEMCSASHNFHTKTLLIGGEIGLELNISGAFLTLFIVDENPVFKITPKYADAVRIFFEAFEKIAAFESNPYRAECILSLLRTFFFSSGYFLYKMLGYKDKGLYGISTRLSSYDDNIVTRFINMVEANSATQRTLDFYASQIGYNPRYLSSLIKKETGHTGQKIIDQYCILKAMAKLAYSTRSIKEISDEMEFPSQSDFGKYFKRLTGKSPLEYRKSAKSRI